MEADALPAACDGRRSFLETKEKERRIMFQSTPCPIRRLQKTAGG